MKVVLRRYRNSGYKPSDDAYLVWFEGLQYGQSTLQKMVGGPLHVRYAYPDRIGESEKRMFLQDAINLSGANWRGFNAKSLPVSVYYAQIIAEYLKQFDAHGLGVPLSKTGAELLFELVSQRYERAAVLITSNLPFDEWTETFGTERLTGALLDRLTHHVHILEMNGQSFRLNHSRARNKGSTT